MADNHINISIGSSFNGEGFNKLAKSAANVTQTAGKVMNSVGQIGSALGGLDGTLGKVTGAVGNMLGAFAMGGPMGIAIAGVTALVGWIGKMKKESEEAKQKLEQMAQAAEKARIDKAFKDAQTAVANANTALNDHLKALNDAATAADRLAKAEKAVADAQERLGNAQGNFQLAQLQSQIQQNVSNAQSPADKSIEQAKGNVELQQLKNAQALEAANKEIEKARDQLNDATRDLNSLKDTKELVQNQISQIESTLGNAVQDQKKQLDKLLEAEASAEWNYKSLAKNVGEQDKETVEAKEKYIKAHDAVTVAQEKIAQTEQNASKNLADAKNKLKDIELKIAETSAAENAAAKDVEAANVKLATTRVEAETAEREVKDQLKEVQEAAAKEAKAREDAAAAEKRATELKAEAAQRISDAEFECAKKNAAVNDEMDRLKQAIQNAEAAMQNAANGVAWANQHNWGGWGNQEFNPDNFEDFRRASRFGDRAQRDANSRKPGQNRKAGWEKREEELAKRLGVGKDDWDKMTDQEFEDALNGKNGRRLSNAEKNWLRDKRNWDNQQNKGNNKAELERLEREKAHNIQIMQSDVKKIKEDLQDALRVK